MKPNPQHSSSRSTYSPNQTNSSQDKLSSPHHRNSDETGMIAETSLKLFFSFLVSIVATVSLAKLLPYHFAQLSQLKELRAQVQETESRVTIKRQQLAKNFDPAQINTLMEEYSPRIAPNRVRVFWQNQPPTDEVKEKRQ
jgi:hypothetical protein